MDSFTQIVERIGLNPEQVLVLLLVTIVSIWFLGRIIFGSSSRGRLDTVLIYGPCGTGKTSLFYLWKNGKVPETVTSQVQNRGFVLDGVKEEIVDYPGHPRLRNGAYELVPRAKRLVYMVDDSCVKEAAESLFHIFVLPKLNPKTEMMICANKGADVETVTRKLNKEIQLLQQTKSDDGEYVGVEGEDFDIELHAPIHVLKAKVNVRERNVGTIEAFIRK